MTRATTKERRKRARLRLPQVVRVRPSDSQRLHFDEILPTMNTSRDSVYFASKNVAYVEGMRVFITFPYSDAPGSLNRESLGRVVRVDDLGQGRRHRHRNPHAPVRRRQRNASLTLAQWLAKAPA